MNEKRFNIVVSNFTKNPNQGASKNDLNLNIGKFRMEQTATNKTWENELLTIDQIAEKVTNGHYFVPARIQGDNHKRESFSWSSTLVFDFDNGEAPEYVADTFKEMGLAPGIVYSSVSDSPEQRKYRVMIFLDEAITDVVVYEDTLFGIMYELWANYGITADTNAMDATRAFYPGKDIIIKKNIVNSLQTALDYKQDKAEVKKVLKEEKEAELENEAKAKGVTVSDLNRENQEKKTYTNKMAEAMVNHNIEACRELIGYPLQVDGWDKMNRADKLENVLMTNIFGVKIGEKFHCLLPEHNEEEPSANIFIGEGDQELYKCHGCGKSYQLHTLVGKLTGKGTRETAKFMKDITGLEWLSNYQINTMIEIDNLKQILYGKDFEIMYPMLSKKLFTVRHGANLFQLYEFLLDQSSMMVLDESISNDPNKITFFISLDAISDRMKKKNLKGVDRNGIHDKIHELAKRGLIQFETEVRSDFLGKAKNLKKKNGYTRHTAFYTINIDVDVFSKAEELTVLLKRMGDRSSRNSSVQVSAIFGEEKVKDFYTQDTKRSPYSELTRMVFEEIAEDLLDRQGYVAPLQVVSAYCDRLKGKYTIKQAQNRFETYRGFFTNEVKYKKVIVNKDRREAMNIPAEIKSNGVIFMRVEEA